MAVWQTSSSITCISFFFSPSIVILVMPILQCQMEHSVRVPKFLLGSVSGKDYIPHLISMLSSRVRRLDGCNELVAVSGLGFSFLHFDCFLVIRCLYRRRSARASQAASQPSRNGEIYKWWYKKWIITKWLYTTLVFEMSLHGSWETRT